MNNYLLKNTPERNCTKQYETIAADEIKMEFKYPIITRYVPPEYPKIPRPANAFMLYANHNRKKMAQMYPLESNKDISKRLGNSWKELESVEKVRYYDLAKQVDADHKRKYPDYVYNPKEARIRKAMREASRERALGVTPMPSPRGSRRPNTWNFGEEEQLMMNPSHGMRGIIGTPMCSSPGFPIPTTGTGSFMQSMHYNKHMHPMSHASNGYMQAPPMNQIPPQSEIWHPYEDSIRSAPTGPYMIPPQIQAYHPPPDIPPPSALLREKPKLEPENFTTAEDTHTNENVPPNIGVEKIPLNEPVFENKVDSIQPLMESGNTSQAPESFMPTYPENVVQQPCRYDKNNDMKMKKPSIVPIRSNTSKPATKPLPDFNEAFGTTERGRFQRPPNKGYLDYFFHDNDMKYTDFQI